MESLWLDDHWGKEGVTKKARDLEEGSELKEASYEFVAAVDVVIVAGDEAGDAPADE